MAIWGPLIGLGSKVVGGIFGMKKKQGDLVQEAIKLTSSIQSDDAKAQVAAFQMAIAESQSESWITRTYRPLIPATYLVFFIMFAFGYTPDALLAEKIPPIIEAMFEILNTIVLVGYPARTVDKLVKQINLGQILKTFIEKKVL